MCVCVCVRARARARECVREIYTGESGSGGGGYIVHCKALYAS